MALIAPSSVVPSNGSTISTTRPSMSCVLVKATHTTTQRAQWQFARNAAFTLNVFTVTESTTDLRTSGSTSEAMPSNRYLVPNGTWYVRARAVSSSGSYGPWSGSNQFTVNVLAPPAPTAVKPANGSTVTTQRPLLQATIQPMSGGRTSYVRWQLSQYSNFPNPGTHWFGQDPSQARTSGEVSLPIASNREALWPNSPWYIRAAQYGTDGTEGPWSATNTFIVDPPAPPVPTGILPADGSVQFEWMPPLYATVNQATDRTCRVRFQLAPTLDFAAEETLTIDSEELVVKGQIIASFPTFEDRLPSQGIWYLRAQQIDQWGETSAWSTPQSFTLFHPPVASWLTPASGEPLLYQEDMGGVLLNWRFTDPAISDTQSAYQVEIRQSTGELIVLTEKVHYEPTESVYFVPIEWASVQQLFESNATLQWRVKLWDSQDQEGDWTPWVSVIAWRIPQIEIITPSAGILDNGRPIVSWQESGVLDTVFVSAIVTFYRNSDGAVVWKSSEVKPYVESYQPRVNVLENEKSYRIEVVATDKYGLKAIDAVNVETSYVAPPNVDFYIDSEAYRLNGYMLVDWSATQADQFFIAWNVYRREFPTSTWELVHVESNSEVHDYQDWLVLTGHYYDYAVTQVADRSGLTFESAIAPTSSPIQALGEQYWLIDPEDTKKNLLLFNVVSDSFNDSIEQETYVVLGRGRRTDYGTDLGIDGSLTAQLRDRFGLSASAQLEQLRSIKRERSYFLLRTPFGQIFQISIGDLAVSRITGVGPNEYVDVSFPYTEVS